MIINEDLDQFNTLIKDVLIYLVMLPIMSM